METTKPEYFPSAAATKRQLDAAMDLLEAITEVHRKSLIYWQALYKLPLLPGAAGGAQGPLADMMNDAYNRWMEATRALYKGPSA